MGEPGFVVDPGAVHAFGRDFQHDLDVHLSAEKVRALHLFAATPVFGTRAVNKDVQQAATDYVKRLQELFDLMEVLLYNGSVMAQAAHEIAEAYESADSLTADQVSKALGNARAAVTADADAVDPRTGRPV
ncbi:hypothetical protein ABT369_43355 [Dactylosporangium sp. NPDC000244]|uniref:hypothetical protein n=1 Tax=Dactylosporangium sp. NPDC000244 TaxID=3154365 RepID=UPI003317345D